MTVTDNSGVYNGLIFVATDTVAGVGTQSTPAGSLEGVAPTLYYYSGTSATGTILPGAPTTAGTYTVLASFAGSTDYTTASATTTFTISKAAPTVTVTDAGGTASGTTAFPATDTVAGVNQFAGASLEEVSLYLTYYSGTSASGTPLAGAPSAAGTYTALATFAGSNNYISGSASTTFTIAAGGSTIIVTTTSDAVGHTGESLRDAIATANADALNDNSDTITFVASLNGQTITLSQGQLELGQGGAGSGAITINGGGSITVSGNNASQVFLVDTGVQASLTGLTITDGNASTGGGGGIENEGTLTVSNSMLSGNSSYEFGGGIENEGTLTVNNSTFSGNSTTSTFLGVGGGIENEGALTVTNSTLSGNTAAVRGGGIDNDGTLTVSNSTLSENSAPQGGGINNAFSCTLTVSNSTISGNTASSSGGGINNDGTLTLLSTIVAGNTATADDPDIDGQLQSGSTYNLIGDGTGMTGITNGTDGNQVGTASSPINPLLGPLANDGGTTQNMALLTGSPAINAGGLLTTVGSPIGAGDTTIMVAAAAAIASTPGSYVIQIDSEQMLVTNVNLANNALTVQRGYNGTAATSHNLGASVLLPFDQRGSSRVGAPDIGAYEFGASLVVTTVSDAPSHTGESLRDAIAAANTDAQNGISDTITFASSLNGQTITLAQGPLALGAASGTITINGGGVITVNGNNASRVFGVYGLVTLTGLTINGGNTGDGGQGGGIYNYGGTLTVSNSTLSGNSASQGSGIYNGGTLLVSNSTVSANTIDPNPGFVVGGAIFNEGTLTVSNSTFSGNADVIGDAGGIYNDTNAASTVIGSTFSGNSASQYGGVIYSQGSLSVSNSTFFGNTGLIGGGIANYDGTLTVSNSTFSGNISPNGGGIANLSGTVTLLSTIVAGNTDSGGVPHDVGGQLQSDSTNNLIGDGSGMTGISNGTGGNQVGTDSNPIDPLLGALASNGGPTQTMALLAGSPAINAGSALTTVSYPIGVGDTTITVGNAAAIASTPGYYFIEIDSEQMLVTNVNLSTNSLTVERGYNDTIAAVHETGAGVYLPFDQRVDYRVGVPDIGAYEFAGTPSYVVATVSGGTYNGSAFVATATVNGAASLERVAPTLTYYVGSAVNGSGTSAAPIYAGTYTVVASFAGSTDYPADQSSPVTFTITQATPSISLTDNSGTYTGSYFTATATSLEGVTPTLTYYSGTSSTGTPLAALRRRWASTRFWPALRAAPTIPAARRAPRSRLVRLRRR